MAETLIVNWNQQIKGGCESHSEEISKFLGGRVVDLNTAMNAIGTRTVSEGYYPYAAVEHSIILTRYIRAYAKRFPLDAVISMDFCLAPGKFDIPVIAVSGNPYSDIAHFLHKKGLYNEPKANEIGYTYTWMQRQQFSNAEKIVAVSPYMQDYIKALGFDSEVIEHGVDLKMFRYRGRERCREELGLPLDKTIVICPTKFLAVKGWHITAELIKRNPDVHWLVIFSHKEQPNTLLENVTVKSYLSREEMAKCYSASDIYLLPSCIEGFNRTAVEAMACGLPIITQQAGIFSDIVGPGMLDQEGIVTDYGLIVSRWEAKAYQNALNHMLKNKEPLPPTRPMVRRRWNILDKQKQWKKLVAGL